MISAIDFERAVIAATIKEQNASTIEVIERLEAECFESKFCSTVWKTIKKLHKQNEPIDLVTVAGSDHELGESLYAMLSSTSASPAIVKAYAKKVRQAYNLRNTMLQMQDAIKHIQDCSDPSEIGKVASQVAQAFSKITIETDNKLPRSGAEILPDYVDMMQRRHEGHDSEKTINLGIEALDLMLGGLNPVDLVVVGGCSGMGKTEFANKIANGVLLSGRGVLNFTMEMDEMQIIERSVSDLAHVPVGAMRSPRGMDETQWGKVSNAMSELNNDLYWVHDESGISVEQICSHAKLVKNKQPKLSLIVVDYAQIMKTPSADRHDLAIGIISMSLKKLAKELRCPVVLLSQLNEKQIKSRTDKRPVNADLKDSASLINDADRIIMLYRDEVYHPDTVRKGTAEIIVTKNRFGQTGTVYQGWANGHFIDISVDDVARMAHAEESNSKPRKHAGLD